MAAPTILPLNPFDYVHPKSLCRPNVQYANHVHARLDIRHNATRVPRAAGGNPVFVILHGGSNASNHKSVFGTMNTSASLGRFYDSTFLASDVYGTDEFFDVVHLEIPVHAHEGVPPHELERLLALATEGITCESYSVYGVRIIQYIQQALQWIRANALQRGWNPDRIVLFGHSMGGWGALCAAFTPGAHFNPHATDPFTPRAPFKLRGVVQWAAEVDLDPRLLFHRVSRYTNNLLDVANPDGDARVKARINRLYLKPDANGAYSASSEKTELCKALSPVDLILRRLPEHSAIQVLAIYRKNFVDGTTGQASIEETVDPAPGETTIPPYWAAGHDWRQGALLKSACDPHRADDPGIACTLTILDGEGGAAFQTYGNPQMEAYESVCMPTYAWAVDVCA
jgi:acetyl esterase/lipase